MKNSAVSRDDEFDIKRALRETKESLRAMTQEQKRQLLVRSGILTPGGKVAKPYAGIFVPLK